jgi:carbohydrate kinase (thermoresistant glucokinase family)
VILVVMGVAGSGKTTVGKLLARRLGLSFCDADELHPPANIAKMEAGEPLTDADRQPWLRAIADWADEHRRAGTSAVLACSALKASYRAVIRGDNDDVQLIYLRGPRSVLAERLAGRFGHFFSPTLLNTQLDTLEEPTPDEDPVEVDISQTAAQMVERIVTSLPTRIRRDQAES